jgi:hypothetical protein
VANEVDCQVNQLGAVYEVHEQSRWAFADFYAESYSTALTRFQPVANLDRATHNAAECVHKINFARCIVGAIENSQAAAGYDEYWYEGASKELTEGAGPILISPNPATNHLQLLGPTDQQYQLHVYDLMGRLLQSDFFNGNYDMNISNWQSGLYFFSILNEKEERVQATKVSVQ